MSEREFTILERERVLTAFSHGKPLVVLAAVEAILAAREADSLLSEAEWLEKAHANSADKGYSDEYRKGFAAAAGWVRFHAEHHLSPFRMTDDDAIRRHMADRGGRMTYDRASDPQEDQ